MDEQRNIACSFAKRRKQDGKNVQPIIQVHAEPPFGYHLLKILICRGNYPHIDSSRLRTPDSFELLLLNHAQELGLKLDRQFANFIEEKRTAIGGLKATYSMCQGSSEGASLMSKEFALDQRSGNGRAVDCYKSLPAAGACIMNGSCDHFLPCTRFTSNEDGTIHGRHGPQLFNYGEKVGTRSNEARIRWGPIHNHLRPIIVRMTVQADIVRIKHLRCPPFLLSLAPMGAHAF